MNYLTVYSMMKRAAYPAAKTAGAGTFRNTLERNNIDVSKYGGVWHGDRVVFKSGQTPKGFVDALNKMPGFKMGPMAPGAKINSIGGN